MVLTLHFNSPYKSITPFDDVTASTFMVLTGVNGSGKSQLLEALQGRNVVFSEIPDARIARFNYESFKLENEQSFAAQQIYDERNNAWQWFEQNVKPQIAAYRVNLLQGYIHSEGTNFWQEGPGARSYQYERMMHAYLDLPHIKQNPASSTIISLMKRFPNPLTDITREAFFRSYKPYTYKSDFLPSAIGKVIWDYWIQWDDNRYNRYRNERDAASLPVLSDEEFIAEHGEKPWDIINRILGTFGSIEYRVNSPENLDRRGAFKLQLLHTRNPGLAIDFDNLSSGERVLMALVASVYKVSSDGQFPDILLLDELDASLHPSMIKSMMAVINDIFIKRGTQVVLVTHSPTTIALAPEESVYVMRRSGQRRIAKQSKDDALKILTEGFATLSEGLVVFDEISSNACSIVTEGNNTTIVEKACELYGMKGVKILKGAEDRSGNNQMNTLMAFLSRIPHKSKVIFVYDWDVKVPPFEGNNTFALSIAQNPDNHIAQKGIENAFSEDLLADFTQVVKLEKANGEVLKEHRQFDGRKREFAEFIVRRANKEDFVGFETLMHGIQSILSQDSSVDTAE